MAEEHKAGRDEPEDDPQQKDSMFTVAKMPDERLPERLRFELRLEGAAITPSVGVERFLASIIQDLREFPDNCLAAVGDGAYQAAWCSVGCVIDSGAQLIERHVANESTCPYDEWDHR